MSKQSENEGSGRVQFQNSLAAAFPIIKSKPFINIVYDELNYYAGFLQYRVQRDLYELYEENFPGNISWDDFILLMRSVAEMRDAALTVICRKMDSAFYNFDFTSKEIYFFRESDASAGDWLGGAVLFSREEGLMLMGMFLYFAECAHFNHLQDTVRPGYKWDKYFNDLQHNQELWRTVLTAFRDAIQRLDFKADWVEVLKEYEE